MLPPVAAFPGFASLNRATLNRATLNPATLAVEREPTGNDTHMPNVIERLHTGLAGRAEIVVAEWHTAPHVGSGHVHVLATPVMVNLMEAAALQAVDDLLRRVPDRGHAARHPPFRRHPGRPAASARAEVVAIEGRTLTFRLTAEDEREPIGDGRTSALSSMSSVSISG